MKNAGAMEARHAFGDPYLAVFGVRHISNSHCHSRSCLLHTTRLSDVRLVVIVFIIVILVVILRDSRNVPTADHIKWDTS